MIMKQFFNHAFLGAIALTGAVCFSACSSKDDLTEDVNPTYDPVANTIKANFSFALTSNLKGGSTRMTADSTQANGSGKFFGISNFAMIPFDCPVADLDDEKERIGDNINTNFTTITASSENANSDSYNYHYYNVNVPIGTQSLLVYGYSSDTNGATPALRFRSGVLNQVDPVEGSSKTWTNGNANNFEFDLVPIIASSDVVNDDNNRKSIITYLNQIAGAKVADDDTWASPKVSNAGLTELYNRLIGMKAGSTASVRAAVQDLYSSVYAVNNDMYRAIATAITTTYAQEDTGNPGKLEFLGNMANNYPQDINLPSGSAVIKWDDTNKVFETPTDERNYKTMNVNVPTKYVYPAGLYYYVKSGISTSTSKQDAAYKGASNDWSTILGNYVSGDQVTPATIDVALKEEIQYGVGSLQLQVYVDNTLDGTNKVSLGGVDNTGKKVLLDKKGEEVVIPNDGYPVTGILIGGQRFAKWNFEPVAEVKSGTPAVVQNEYVIFDNALGYQKSGSPVVETSRIMAGTADPTVSNYTLVLETDPDATRYIAVEMINTGEAFEGADGMVPANGRFYLVAELDPSKGTGYEASGANALNQVFKKDYVTSVKLKVLSNNGADHDKGLGAAYNTIPDLGTPAMRLGFSVDLTWTQGLVFNINF